jgi:hypothetical protein
LLAPPETSRFWTAGAASRQSRTSGFLNRSGTDRIIQVGYANVNNAFHQ